MSEISFEDIPEGLIDGQSTLVQVMAWHETGDKPLPEPELTNFCEDYRWFSTRLQYLHC